LKTNWPKYLITALICLPVFFINIKSSHDWGDDFAQYILQAKNIVNGLPQQQTGYLYNPEFLELGPPTSPVGFPLLLAPMYAIFGNSIEHFNLYISLFLFSFALLMFRFLNKHYSVLISIILVAAFVYNPYTLKFKTEIMSDIPFSLLLLGCIMMYQNEKPFTYIKSILLMLCIGFLISIRNIGIVFLFALVLDSLINLYCNRNRYKQKEFNYKNVLTLVVIALGGLSIYVLLNKVIFKASGEGIFAYSYLLDFERLWYFIRLNLSNYMLELRAFLAGWYDYEPGQFIGFLSGSMLFTFVVLGMIKKLTEKIDFMTIFTVVYLTAIVVYPFTKAGFRLLLPLIPYLLFYCVQGISSINIKSGLKPNMLAIMLAAVLLLSYQKGLSNIFVNEKKVLQGPLDGSGKEAFYYVKKNTPADARFNFVRARAFALYAARECMSHRPNQSLAEIDRSNNKFGVDYILINNEISDDSIKAYVKIHENHWNQVWSNDKYSLYKHRPN
jgi:hypothetical protein